MSAAKKIEIEKLDPENMKVFEAAAYLGIALGTFYNMRYRGEGPKHRKAVGGIRYRKSDLDQWAKENRIDPEG
jgi:excisionase family DNA binding protein